MLCNGVLHSHRIFKTVKLSVTNNKLAVLSNKFRMKNLCYIFIVKNNSVNNFFAVLI